jgi:hypothetical protein
MLSKLDSLQWTYCLRTIEILYFNKELKYFVTVRNFTISEFNWVKE